MIFVLLTYGGWNEAAYISAELRHSERNMTRVLLTSILIITAVYVGANIVYLNGLGLAATARSNAVAADLMRLAMGENGVRLISLLIVVAALSTLNAVIITGARTNYALGRDFSFLGFLGSWKEGVNAPVNALLLQAGIALLLIVLGTITRSGFSTIVEYTAPVFWIFFLLTGISLFVLRRKDPSRKRPFRVPLYPLTPVLFCLFSLYMLQSSFAYAGVGAVAGVAVLCAGLPVMCIALKQQKKSRTMKAP
jgi:amino acid transporter